MNSILLGGVCKKAENNIMIIIIMRTTRANERGVGREQYIISEGRCRRRSLYYAAAAFDNFFLCAKCAFLLLSFFLFASYLLICLFDFVIIFNIFFHFRVKQ